MADLLLAFKKTVLHNEGPYDNDPKDPGGETTWGITRKYQPSWPGWSVLDTVAPDRRRVFCVDQMDVEGSVLAASVREFYRKGPWAAIRGDEISDQEIAEKLFDISVNCGSARAIRWLQRLLNAFNRQASDYPDMEIDGNFGPRTLESLGILLNKRGRDVILKALNAQQGVYYLEIAEKNQNLESFEFGWWSQRVG